MSLLKAAASSRAKAGYARRRSLGQDVPAPGSRRRGGVVSRMASAEEIMWRDMVRKGVSPEKARKLIASRVKAVPA